MASLLRWSLFVLICGGLPLAALPENFDGRVVFSISFNPAVQPLTHNQLLSMLPLRAGQPLSTADLRAAIQQLYLTGEYSDIAVDAEPAGMGVALTFITKPAFFVGHVTIQGVVDSPNPGQVEIATKLQLGAEYSPRDTEQAVESIQDLLRRNGLYRGTVTPEVTMHDATQDVDIDFRIVQGQRAKFGGLRVTGTPERPLSAILRSTGWKTFRGWLWWRPVTEARVQSGLEGVRSWYVKHDRLLARVQLTKLDFLPETNRVLPTLDITAGPIVKVRVDGAHISRSRLQNVLPIYQERSVDTDLLVEGRTDLTQYFQSQGYFDAEVRFQTAHPHPQEQIITYGVDKGARHKLVHLEIEGNKYFDTETIRERMYVTPASFLRFPHGRYSREYMNRDCTAIADLYRANGFRDVKVTAHEIDDYAGKPANVAVIVTIAEGPQWFVNKLVVSGVSQQDRTYLDRVLVSNVGQPYSDVNIATDRDNILQYYFDNGYPEAKFEFVVKQAAPQREDLQYTVTPGRREYVRRVLVSGLATTRPEVVWNRMELKPGDPLGQGRITDTQRKLYDLGIFARVNTGLQNPDGEEPTKYVLYSLDEARRYSLNVGFGAEIARIGGGSITSLTPTTDLSSPAGATGFSPRVTFGVTRLNFLGLAHTVSLQTQVSTLQQRALFNYIVPQYEGHPNLNLQFTALFDISKDVRTFSAKREEGSIQLGQKLSRANSMQYRYVFRNVSLIGTPLISPELIPLFSHPVRVGLMSATFIQDRRDDPIDPHRGMYNTVDFGAANHVFGSQTGFGRVVARNAMYHHISKNFTLARVTLFGGIQRYSGLPDIPLPERFFSGGSNSQRAFPDNQAGPRDPKTGFPIGGNAVFMNTIELRFPFIGENIDGVFFNDMGNVYSDIRKISLRFNQRNLQDFDYGVQAFGFGIRYRTPVGPVRIDLSYSPNSPHFYGFKGTLDQLITCSSPNPATSAHCTGSQTVQRINPFQFHISLGQAF